MTEKKKLEIKLGYLQAEELADLGIKLGLYPQSKRDTLIVYYMQVKGILFG